MYYSKDSPVNTDTIEHIQDVEAGYTLVRNNETRHFTFKLKSDPPERRRIYSWDPKKSDGIPAELDLYGTRTMYVWFDKEEVAFNPQLLKDIQEKIQKSIDSLISWNCRSVFELESMMKDFLCAADGRIFSESNDTYSFESPWSFLMDLSIYSNNHRPLELDKKYGNKFMDYRGFVDLQGNVLVALKDGSIVHDKIPAPKVDHMSDIEFFFYRCAEQFLYNYYDNSPVSNRGCELPFLATVLAFSGGDSRESIFSVIFISRNTPAFSRRFWVPLSRSSRSFFSDLRVPETSASTFSTLQFLLMFFLALLATIWKCYLSVLDKITREEFPLLFSSCGEEGVAAWV